MLELRDLESRILRRQEEDGTKFKELRARLASMVEAVSHLTSHLSLCTISTPIVRCGETIKELSEEVNLKLHGKEGELKQGVQQEEKVEIIEQKKVVDGCLGYVEHIKEFQAEEPSSTEYGRDVKKESKVAEVNGELKEIDQEVDSITSDFLPTLINSLENIIEPSPSGLESKVEEDLGLNFVDRDLGRINTSWVRKFYCNFFRATLDSVQLWGREIMITEAAIRDALLCRLRPDDTCAYKQAEVAIHCMTFDYEALKRVIATPDAPWVMDSRNKKPKGMHFTYLSREARTWQHIFAHYVFPTTHFSEISMDMLVLISCVMEGKEVNFSRLIRQSMWRAYICGLLPFPTLVTSMIEMADVPWEDDDVTPPPPDDEDKDVTIPWGGWVHKKPPSKRRSRARVVEEATQPSSLAAAAGPPFTSAAAASLPPPPAPEPTYLLVQHLLCFMERLERRVMRRLDRIDQDQEEELAEEPIHQDAPPETQVTTEVQHPPQVQQDTPRPQPEPVPEPQPVPIFVLLASG
ncbi:hypothetical protein Ahy_B08g091350 [Arachis hypogaea]|uniref:Putative plant transposon protein domain-containing protein n=1 Tax=Arachis hypogaea TaxID=3818 RepID=A0A444Y1Z9_ARAHY|nr:hypothetical protein Ahy_B08g091350 [Arachis hypogaea]